MSYDLLLPGGDVLDPAAGCCGISITDGPIWCTRRSE
jgi:hypothetical protein